MVGRKSLRSRSDDGWGDVVDVGCLVGVGLSHVGFHFRWGGGFELERWWYVAGVVVGVVGLLVLLGTRGLSGWFCFLC